MSDWIKSHVDIADHPKIHVLASSLNVRIPSAIGTVHLLWYFAMRYAWKDGDLTRFGVIAIARACHAEEEPALFISRLQKAGFLDGLKVHDWLDMAGRLVRDRIRYRKANGIRTQSVRSTDGLRTEYVAKRRVEESRGEKSREHRVSRTFSKPTAAEVEAYAKDKGYQFDAEKFVDFYESKGWLVGKSPMKDWRAAVRTWKRNGYGTAFGPTGYITPVHPKPSPPSAQEQEQSEEDRQETLAVIENAKKLIKPKAIPR